MSSRNDDRAPAGKAHIIPGTVPVNEDAIKGPGTVSIDEDDIRDRAKGGNTRGSSYMELHGDIHDGQELPEEKD